ncbi:protein translocase subunit SecF [Catenovulum maritimum]|uniref:Protein-export membrane protein SecF n=1 Tax=Catenovulum maritimum TaxID=1513271 RepID=A0A0J8GVR8_9ALTE|nr:protein translocase subunit SecF [Catenovulum maritimum]KMT66847.1 preprotein translocase subunit SecF [Catenovulum maritimum]
MRIMWIKNTIQFMSWRKIAMAMSFLLIATSIGSLATKGLQFGLDFTGGTLIEVGYEQGADLEKVRAKLDSSGFPDAVVQHFGSNTEVLIRLAPREDTNANTLSNQVLSAISTDELGHADMRRIEFVGPSVGEELKEQGGLAMLVALICILIYVAFRFEWRFALGSVLALAHDVIITVGLFSVLSIEFDLNVLAAVLAVIGYSLNDTIVVSDRIRENFRKLREIGPEEVINISLTQTLSRTMITSVTTILVLLALFFVGGELIHGFATALLFGVVIGTYSSVYVASSLGLMLGISRDDLIPTVVEKEGEDQDAIM